MGSTYVYTNSRDVLFFSINLDIVLLFFSTYLFISSEYMYRYLQFQSIQIDFSISIFEFKVAKLNANIDV